MSSWTRWPQVFTAADDSVETLNGHQWLKDVYIQDGLRLGAETVEQRVNEALQKASAVASETIKHGAASGLMRWSPRSPPRYPTSSPNRRLNSTIWTGLKLS